ncbi:MAG: hypothetical protein KDK26_01130 [Roseivivax sp.]|nr:hypothetical protein [Roseivivax sp.]
MTHRSVGHWTLIPELCHYAPGSPPEDGRYEIGLIDGRFVFVIRWTKDGAPQTASFSAPADGSEEPSDLPGLTHFTVSAPDPSTLDSAAFAGQTRRAWARRRVSQDGTLLSVYMENPGPEGPQRIYQVYRRS